MPPILSGGCALTRARIHQVSRVAGSAPWGFDAPMVSDRASAGSRRIAAADLPIFDAHLHYSHDAWETLPPKDAIAILRKAGLKRALISSSGDDGQQRLHAEAPDLVLRSRLRPYRSRGDVSARGCATRPCPRIWKNALKKYRYVAIGEFHLYGADADLPVPRRLVQLAKQHGLVLHAHSDADAVERLFKQWPRGEDPLGAFGLRPAGESARDAAAGTRTCGRPRVSQRPRLGRQGEPGMARGVHCSFPTASWSAPIRSRPSAGTTSSSTRTGRAQWLARPSSRRRGAHRMEERRRSLRRAPEVK